MSRVPWIGGVGGLRTGHVTVMHRDERLGDRYRMVERLGAGGMSVVWRGYDEVLGRQVAIKVLARQLAADRAFRRRIRIEAQAAARLCHPNITNVYDYGESPGPAGEAVPYVVMELVDGESVAARLSGGRAMPWQVAARACEQVAAALAVAHARGVVHRDITPGNVMLTSTGAKVLDFGISALVGECDAEADGTLLGTPACLAPERLDGGPVSPATDVYALGVLFYRALTGRLPRPADTPTQVIRSHLAAEPAPIPPIDGLPSQVAAVCRRCLADDPADRPSSAEVARELAAALEAVPAPGLDVASTLDEAIAVANASTGILPWPTATDALPTSVRQRISAERRQRGRGWLSPAGPRARAGLVAAGLVAAVVAVWAGTAWSPGPRSAHGTTAVGLGPASSGCAVEYRLQRDTGTTFTTDVAVQSTGAAPLRAWRLTFDLPGDQRLRNGTGAAWRQDGRTVTAHGGGATLAPDATARLTFTADYRTGNPFPVTFRVNDTACHAVLLGAATTPVTRNGTARNDDRDKGTNGHHGKGKGKGSGKRD